MRIDSVLTTRSSVPRRTPMRTETNSIASTENVLIAVLADPAARAQTGSTRLERATRH
jgi:hypothetical protein